MCMCLCATCCTSEPQLSTNTTQCTCTCSNSHLAHYTNLCQFLRLITNNHNVHVHATKQSEYTCTCTLNPLIICTLVMYSKYSLQKTCNKYTEHNYCNNEL